MKHCSESGKELRPRASRSTQRASGIFRRELLPPATSFYQRELGQLTRPDRKGWARGRCPFHQSKGGKFFSVHVDGAFYCHGCGVKGGDLIAFIRLRDGLNFKDACHQLGAWSDDGRRTKLRPGPLVRFLVLQFTIDGEHYRAEIEDKPRNELQRLRRFHAEARDRLHGIHNGDREVFEGEEGIQWGVMASSFDLIRMEEMTDAR